MIYTCPKIIYRQFKRGEAPLLLTSPSPFKERGIKGVRLIDNPQTLALWKESLL